MSKEIIVYHNPYCSKSNAAVCSPLLINQNVRIIDFTDISFTREVLEDVLQKLNYKPSELIRSKEDIYQRLFHDKTPSENDLLHAMLTYSELIERPIIVFGDKAIIARPQERIGELIDLHKNQ